MLSDYILSVVTFRVIARDSMSPSFQSFLSGPPFFSSACTPQRRLALSTSRLLCAFLPAFCPQVEPSCKLWAAQGCGRRWVCWFLTHSKHCWSTSCWAGPWLAASTGSSLPARIHGPVGEVGVVSVYSDLHA